MRPFAFIEFLLIASLAVALIVKPPPREATAKPAVAPAMSDSATRKAPTTQPSAPTPAEHIDMK